MRFPIKEKDIIELSIEENEINALCKTFESFYDKEYESIEFLRRNNKDGTDSLSKKTFYNVSGFIDKIEYYDSIGKTTGITFFEKTKSTITSKRKIPYGLVKEIWSFNQFGNLTNVRSGYGENYSFKYDKNDNLEQVSEGFKFKWKNNQIRELINRSDNSVIQRVINKNESETTIAFVGRKNKNESGIRTYKYDNLGRLIRIESRSDLRLTEIKYETRGYTKIQTSTNYIDNEPTSFSSIIERNITKGKIEIEFQFQQRKNGRIMTSRIVKTKRKNLMPSAKV